jgi:hypothetical protein
MSAGLIVTCQQDYVKQAFRFHENPFSSSPVAAEKHNNDVNRHAVPLNTQFPRNEPRRFTVLLARRRLLGWNHAHYGKAAITARRRKSRFLNYFCNETSFICIGTVTGLYRTHSCVLAIKGWCHKYNELLRSLRLQNARSSSPTVACTLQHSWPIACHHQYCDITFDKRKAGQRIETRPPQPRICFP